MTLEGAPVAGHDTHRVNALTGHGMSYYVNAANMHMTGSVQVDDDVDIEFEGNAWTEHQVRSSDFSPSRFLSK
jgi:predicted secreted hydrolase